MAIKYNLKTAGPNLTSREIQEIPFATLTGVDVEYAENGEYTVNPPTGYDGLSSVNVTVDVQCPTYASDVLTATANGTYAASAAGLDGYSTVTVDVPSPTLGSTTVNPATSQQVIEAASGTGFDTITVNAVTAAIDSNITAGNIKKDVEILGITGTFDPTPTLETVTAGYTANGTYTITASTGYDGIESVEVTVNVAGGCVDWESIGWTCSDVNDSALADDIAYTKSLYESYTPPTGFTSSSPFADDQKLVFAPKVSPVLNGSASIGSAGFYAGCSQLQYVAPVTFNHNTGYNTIVANKMFNGCVNLKSVSVDLRNYYYTNPSDTNYYVSGAPGMFSNCNKLTDVTLTNTNKLTWLEDMFSNCSVLVNAPSFNTSKVVCMKSMFQRCTLLTSVPLYDTSLVTDMSNMFYECKALTTIPQFNTSSVENMSQMFIGTNMKLQSIPQLDASKVTNPGMFSPYNTYAYLTTLGGFTNMGKAFTTNEVFNMSQLTALTYQSIMNVINNLAQPDAAGVTPTLTLASAVYNLLSAEDIAIATGKGWSVTH